MKSELVEPQLPVGYRASVPTPTELPAPLSHGVTRLPWQGVQDDDRSS